ncbi:MAG: hypothetical protein JWP66_619 [Naasia sp.]|nr:hypothetical protein [Naasia sp.]
MDPHVTVRFLAASKWPTLMTGCLTDHGYPARVADTGTILRTLPSGGSELGAAMADYDCARRYLQNGYYFHGAP